MTADPWYRDGLRFSCTRCGHCCSGQPGSVRVSDEEIETFAEHLDLANREFREVYTRSLRGGDVSLREKSNGECVFFDRDGGCSVYALRPQQCRTWPFWRGVVHSEQRWSEEARDCPGMNRGSLRAADEILQIVAADGTRRESA